MARSSRNFGEVIGDVPAWKPHEAPLLPGSPSTPDFSPGTRLIYGLVGLLLGVTGALGSALLTVNLPAIQGALGLEPAQGAWISAAYVMGGVAMNLLLIKYRQQFGLGSFVKVFLGLYAAAAVAQALLADPTWALAVRVVSGVAGAAMTTFTIFYMLQAFDAQRRLVGLAIGIGLVQVGFPLARVISPALLDLDDWTLVCIFEAGMALACLAAVLAVPLPRGVRYHVFEPQDATSFVLMAGGLGLLAAVAAQGRIQWWFEASWIGWALALAIACLLAAAVLEHRRQNPLIDTRWVSTPDFLRFAVSILLVRILLSEQTYAGPGLLAAVGMGPEQQQLLNGVILIAVLAGVAASGLLLAVSPKFVLLMDLAAPALIVIAALMDAQATVQTHPASLFLSQAIMGFAGAMYICAAFLVGFLLLFVRGVASVITFIVTFSVAQMLGGLLGPTLAGTLQILRANHHSAYLVEQLAVGDPQVAAAVRALAAPQAGVVTDPGLLAGSGLSPLAQQVAQQANILAFNDVFLAIAAIAIVHLLFSIPALLALGAKLKAAPLPMPGAAPAAA
ncbi:MFS transporter [Phenylobacterium sp.]|uniref:MFS transporter n=1 Tax=Phenylobacterium sp. TaxID=1871053 RepID=UPI00289FFC2D|nr:MFS transporter [Phenylobacterium sp.]